MGEQSERGSPGQRYSAVNSGLPPPVAASGSLRRADMDDRRLTELELKFMEQEQALSELSDMVNRQWQEIEGLKGRLLRAQDRIISLEESLPAAAGPEKPPHY